jgi:hypothetical protein
LTQELPNITVRHGQFVDRITLAGLAKSSDIIPKNGKIFDTITRCMGDLPFLEFTASILTEYLRQISKYDSAEESVPILSLFDASKTPQHIADDIVTSFNQLPWSYTFTFELPEALSTILAPTVAEFPLSGNVRLINMNSGSGKRFPFLSGDEKVDDAIHRWGLLSLVNEKGWAENRLYVQVKSTGFVDVYGSNESANEAIDTVKSFFGLCLALKLFKYRRVYPEKIHYAPIYVHRLKAEEGWTISNKIDLDEPLQRAIARISFTDFEPDKPIENLAIKLVANVHDHFKEPLEHRTNDGVRLATACQWLFESYYGADEMLSFVQATVVLEILLGDQAPSNEIGLSELIRNRCAYLIGSDMNERATLLKDFTEIYRVRSAIVHRGKRKLRLAERQLFSTLRWMCERVIQEEARLLAKSAKTSDVGN